MDSFKVWCELHEQSTDPKAPTAWSCIVTGFQGLQSSQELSVRGQDGGHCLTSSMRVTCSESVDIWIETGDDWTVWWTGSGLTFVTRAKG